MKTDLIVGYIRISREDKDKPNYSPELQEASIRQYAERVWQEEPYEFELYQDIGQSGASGLRQHSELFTKIRKGLSDALDRLVAESSEREVHLVCLDQSRLERSALIWELLKHKYLMVHGIKLHLVSEGGQTECTPEGNLTRTVSSAANENYRAQMGRRQRESHKQRARLGYAHGIPSYGWRRVPKAEGQKWHEIEPVPEQHEALLAIKDKIMAGWGSWRIARWLDDQGVPSPSAGRGWYPETVRAVVRNPLHAGLIVFDGERIQGRHYEQRLWNVELSEELDRLISQRHRARRRGLRLGEFMLAGMLTCGHCGRPLTSTYDSTSGKRYYLCNGRMVPARDSHRAVCKRADLMERAVVDGVTEVLSNGLLQSLTAQEVAVAGENEAKELSALAARYQQQQSETTKDLTECISLHRRGELSGVAFHSAKRDYEERLQHLGEQLEQTARRRDYLKGNELRMKSAEEAARNFPLLWDNLDTEERQGLHQALLEEIVACRDGNHLKLQFRFHFLGCQERVLRDQKGRPDAEGVDRLTLRELAFLHLWSRGLRYGDIAEAFGIARGAARQYGHLIRRKLGVASVDAAAELAKDQAELNLPYLPLEGRAHRSHANQRVLSVKETLVLERLAEGLTYGECAQRIGISLTAAYNAAYIARQKMGVADNLEALARARETDAAGVALAD